MNEFRRGWGVVVASTVGIGLGLSAVPFYSLGVFAGPVTEAYGWTRGQYMSVTIFMVVALLFLGPLVGRLADRGLVRPLAIGSLGALALCFFALAALPQDAPLWAFYAGYVTMTVVSAGSLSITFTRSVTGWFVLHRGLALAISLCGVGLCAFFLPSYAEWAIASYGFRGGYVAVGLLPLLIAVPVTAMLLRDPPAAAQPGDFEGRASVETGRGLDGALRDRRFWVLVGLAIFASAAASGTAANLVPILVDDGYERATAARMAGVFGLALIVGRLVTGALMDRFWAPLVGCVSLAICAAGLTLFTVGEFGPAGDLIAVASVGFASGAEIDLIAYLVSRYFPERAYARIYGVLYSLAAAGGGAAAATFGRAYDVAGSYDLVLTLSSVALAATALSLLAMGPYPRGDSAGEVRVGV